MSLPARAEYLWKAVRSDVATERLWPSFITSIVVTMMTVVLSVSYVALIFVGPLTSFVGIGTSVMLMMAVILGVFMACFSSYAGMIAIPQDRVAPIVGLMATIIIHEMPSGASVETIGVTVLAAIALTTLVTGLTLVFLGAYKLGNIVRFTPYPVIGGFLAGSGWLLLLGSFRVVSGEQFSLHDLGDMWASGVIGEWMPCAVFGVVACIAVRYSRHYLTLPAIVSTSIALFYWWLWLSHHSLGDARQHGWIFEAPRAGLAEIRIFPSLVHADWGVIANQGGSLVALLLTSIVSILLNTSALELAADEEIDLNQELRAAGLANLVGGFTGGMIGFQSLNLSVLPLGMGVKSRLVGVFSAAACFLLLIFGTGLFGYIPKFILGGILFYSGLTFLIQWIYDAYFRLLREDYLLVVLILAIVAVFGYLQGVGAGVITAAVLFVLKYSSVNVISHTLSGDSHRSSVDRAPEHARLLEREGGQIHILMLKGFIFFGSADNVLNTIRARNADRTQPPLSYLVLDFQHVSGLDTSGIVSISKLSRLAKRAGFSILAASVPESIRSSFHAVGLLDDGPGQVRLFPDRDHCIEWCENQIVHRVFGETFKEVKELPKLLNDFHPWRVDTGKLIDYMDRLEVPADYYLIRQGEAALELFFIESGSVKVIVQLDSGRTIRVRTMGAGTVVGEIGLYLKQQRVASVITEAPCVLYRLTAKGLDMMEQESPALASAFNEFMVRVLAERVTQQNRTLRALVE